MIAFTFFEGSHVVWCAPSYLFKMVKISSFLICVCVYECVLESEQRGCVPIQGLHPSKDAAYEGVAFVDRGGHTEGPTSVVK